MTRIVPLACLTLLLLASSAGAQSFDRVKIGEGSKAGRVTKMTPLAVTITGQAGLTEEIPVNKITGIIFVGEPRELATARLNASNGRYEDAKTLLATIEVNADTREAVKQDIEFLLALCESRLALGGAGDIKEAGRMMYNFERNNRGSYHYLEACEVLGDVFVSMGNYAQAVGYYDKLSQAPWPDYKMRSGVLVGRALQAQKKHSEAIAKFNEVLAIQDDSAEGKRQKLAATLGKAISTAETNDVDGAIKMVNQVITAAAPEEAELHARAYNALGQCHTKGGSTKEALLAFLHVDVLYNQFPEAHAEALYHLTRLWDQVGKGDRARQSSVLLKERYPNSRWAQ
jgi:tetratricopeptide (TPR) repeat protein